MKDLWYVVAFLLTSGTYGVVAIPGVAPATSEMSTHVSAVVLASPSVMAFTNSLGLRNSIAEGSAAVADADGSAALGPATGLRLVQASMRVWAFNNPVDRWVPQLAFGLHREYFKVTTDEGLRHWLTGQNGLLRSDAALALQTASGALRPLF